MEGHVAGCLELWKKSWSHCLYCCCCAVVESCPNLKMTEPMRRMVERHWRKLKVAVGLMDYHQGLSADYFGQNLGP